MRDKWTFDLAAPAREYIRQLDGIRKEELITQVDQLSAKPMELLGRSMLGGLEIWKFEYKSDIAPDLLVSVWLSAVDFETRTMLIEFITDSTLPDRSH